jgi:hypothetical protein
MRRGSNANACRMIAGGDIGIGNVYPLMSDTWEDITFRRGIFRTHFI